MEIKVLAATRQEGEEKNAHTLEEEMFIIGGKQAGVCYGKEDYFDAKIQNEETALKRANNCCKSGHHSPFDHCSITLQITGLPKIMAMLLNSIEYYNTSEKSARYTVMTPQNENEAHLYEKWHEIFINEIKKYNEFIGIEMTDKEIDKMALENARYMISVFTPTSMGYTTTYREYNYLVQWIDSFVLKLDEQPNEFNKRLSESCCEFSEKLKAIIPARISDNKDGYIRFFAAQNGHHVKQHNYYGDVYSIWYYGSFAELAQLQRHRTIHYEMEFSGNVPGEYGCYIPELIRNNDKLKKEWVDDFESIAGIFPECTLVKIQEQGCAYRFMQKAMERLCSRAQLEITRQTASTMKHFLENKENLGDESLEMLKKCTNDGCVVPRCMSKCFSCTEHCTLGPKNALTRLI